MRRAAQGPRRSVLGALLVAATLLLTSLTATTISGFASGAISNSTSSASTGTLAFQHAYQSTSCSLAVTAASSATCSGSIAPGAVTSGGASTTDAVTNTGTIPAARLTEQAGAASCGVVQLKNARSSDANPMLPRYATSFQAADPWGGTNAVTFDGSTSYASAVVSQSQPNPWLLTLGNVYGLGIWFKTTSTTGGPLFEIANSATATSGGDDRVLYLTPAGKVVFIQSTGGTSTTSSAGGYNDGAWHFAYVTMSAINIVTIGTWTTTLSVDGGTPVSNTGTFVGYTSDTGYWHLGWAPTSVTGLASAYFAGSLSNFVVFDNAGAPSTPSSGQRASQSAFTTWASAATEQWLLGDDGTTTGATPAFSGSYPVIGNSAPCSMVDIAWAFTNPSGTATAATKLSTFADGTWHSVPAPAPGSTQTSTVTLSRDASYNGYVAGLHLYAPLSMRVLTNPSSTWSLTFAWPAAGAEVIA